MKRLSYLVVTVLLVAGSLFAWAAYPAAPIAGAAGDVVLPVTHSHFNNVEGPLTQEADGSLGVGQYKSPPSPICTVTGSTTTNVNTDCEGNAPHNETSIAVNPQNPLNLVGSANDYQLRLSSGGAVFETAFSRAHVTFDGGKTWSSYAIDYNAYTFTGDPAVAFDADGRAYLATLGFIVSQGNGCCVNPDVVVATSTDGGKTWTLPGRVAYGTGTFGSQGTFNDKEYITAWGHGNAIVTWTRFNDGKGGSYISSPIFASVTHDGGRTWSAGAEISGSASFCVGAQGGTTCDQDQGSVPAVAADGSIYVAFVSTADNATQRDQYLVVKVDASSGQRVAGPFKVANLVDGLTDYPVSIDGRQTYHDSEFRTWSVGNIAADPTHPGHLAVVWSDMRNSVLPAPADPYQANTNSDVSVAQSFDGGQTWSAPVTLAVPGDQFMPWAAYDTSGLLRIGYFDRSYDSANHKYGYTLASETTSGSLSFTTQQLTSTLSDPTQGDRWFSGSTPNVSFPHPTTFLGDYSGISAQLSGGIAALWTDMRLTTTFSTRTGSAEDAFYSAAP